MPNELQASKWVNMVAGRKAPPKTSKSSYNMRNNNLEGRFPVDVILTGGGKRFEVSAGTEYCVFGAMGGTGVAATITDPLNGDITIRKNGKMTRREPERPLAHPLRSNVPLGIG